MTGKFKVEQTGHDDKAMLTEELQFVGQARPAAADIHALLSEDQANDKSPYLIGLAFSGGGIRSATVSLGIMQKLAADGILKHVDYLSTVSGGGYIGSALTWWLRKDRAGYDTDLHLPFGTEDPEIPQVLKHPPLDYLRQQGKYLTPGNGITIWSSLSIVFRSIFLNLLVWIPVATLAILILHGIGRWPVLNGLPYMVNMIVPGALPAVSEAAGTQDAISSTEVFPPVFLLMLLIAAGLIVLFLLGSVNHSLLSWTDHTEPPRAHRRGADSVTYRDSWRWIWAGLIAVAGLALLGLVGYWLLQVAKPLFDTPTSLTSPPGGLVDKWPWLIAITVATGVFVYWLGSRDGERRLTGANRKQVWYVVAGFALLLALDWLLTLVPESAWPDWLWSRGRFSALLQFLAGIGFLAYANYWVGMAIRHVLRFQALGRDAQPTQEPSTSLLEYHARRLFESFYGAALFTSLALIAVGILPFFSAYIDYRLGGISAALGLLFTAAGQWRSRAAGYGRLTSMLIMVGAALLAYGVLLIGYRLSLAFMNGDVGTRAAIATSFFVSIITGWFVNTNHVGLHRYYRDRLMEAFMPDDATADRGINDMARGANEFQLADAWDGANAKGPYHLLNTNVVLTNSKERKYRLRGGDNFILSPLFAGSGATNWRRMSDYDNGDITLASAMATSAAAANPQGGAAGKGITRSPSVSIAMGLLNIRLGYWLRNPQLERVRGLGLLSRRPNHFWPGGTYALTGGGYREDCNWLEIADGGHFENLAIYELVRRRCGLIIVCDGGRDNKSSYGDLVSAVQRVGEDFGAAVRFDMEVKEGRKWEKSSPARLIARHDLTDYPKGVEFAAKGYFVATIDYGMRGGGAWPEKGTIVYLKSSLIMDLDIRAKGYRGANDDFPNQSTGDQFFDEEQFEAYREVGYRVCEQMSRDLGLTRLFAAGRPSLKQLRGGSTFRPK